MASITRAVATHRWAAKAPWLSSERPHKCVQGPELNGTGQRGIKLQADHRIPQSWGGPTTIENLWALCEACNRGKRNYFASFNDKEMEQVVNFVSVHERIVRFLKLHMPNPVPAYAIEFVANAKEQQLDWRKRLRELRYDPIGLQIDVSKKTR